MARPTKGNPKGKQRKSKFTPQTIEKLKVAFSMDCTITEACLHAEIDISTFYLWKKENPKLIEQLESLRWTPILKARTKVVAGIDESYFNAMDYLKRKRKDEFSERHETRNEDTLTISDDGMKAVQKLLALKNGSKTTPDSPRG